jgi:hypothetical protein
MEANVQQSFSSYIGFNFCSYSSFDEGRKILNQNVAISVICYVDKGYFAMHQNKQQVLLKIGQYKITYFQMNYFNWTLDSKIFSYTENELKINHYGVLLLLQKQTDIMFDESVSFCYTFLTSEYKEIQQNGTIGKSQFLQEQDYDDEGNDVMSEQNQHLDGEV